MYMMSAAWASLAIVLSALAAAYTWLAWKHQGLRGLVRGTAITMMPIALWLTGTLRLVATIGDWFASWATGLVLSPSVIVGTVLFVGSIVLFGASGRISRRDRPSRVPRSERPERVEDAIGTRAGAGPTAGRPTAARRGTPAVRDDDMDEIEALLRQRGIS